ncbi:MAG: acetolactate synthase small subunit [Lachnospiraceae bacterium]|nr:acetolactate synthase small subunit [Lachnospiraceae bacterium]
MSGKTKNRWIALYVENDVGVLAKVSGLFSAKSYNLQSLTVGTTEHEDVSRMTICVTSDDITFEQIKKQLNTMVEVIKVMDLTDVPIHMKEIMFAKIKSLTPEEEAKVGRIVESFSDSGHIKMIDYGAEGIILESALSERRNNDLAALLRKTFKRIDIVRGGAVAIEGISTSGR